MSAELDRLRLIAGAEFAGWPVYYDTEEDRLCYEVDGARLVAIGEEEEGRVQFGPAEWDAELICVFARKLVGTR